MLTKQGRGEQLPQTLRRPRSGRGLTPPRNRGLAPDLPRLRTGGSNRDPGLFAPASGSALRPPWGWCGPRAAGAEGEGRHPRSCHSVPDLLPPGRGRGAALGARVPASVCSAGWAVTFPHRARCPGPAGRGSRAGTEPSLQPSTSRAPQPQVAQAAGGDGVRRDLGPSSQPGGGGGGAGGRVGGGGEPGVPARPPARGPARRRDLRGAGSRRATQPAPSPPSPSLPCAPAASAHRARLFSREPCPWLHNSPDGIRPGVLLNRAAKGCELPVGRGRPCRGLGGSEGGGWGPEEGALLSLVARRPRSSRPRPAFFFRR